MARVPQPKNTGTKTAAKRAAPVTRRKVVAETQEMEVAPEATTAFTNDGERVDEIEIAVQGDLVNFKDKADRLAFLEEKLTIIINESSEKDAEKYVFCSVNGQGAGPGGVKWLPRNRELTIARKFVEVLAKARPVRYKSVDETLPNGELASRQVGSSSQKYPFTVISDPNPKGREWLSKLLMRRAG